jgi:hypothetical protein
MASKPYKVPRDTTKKQYPELCRRYKQEKELNKKKTSK